MRGIPLDVALDLCHPVARIDPLFELGPALAPVLPMPEVAVTEDYKLGLGENDVGYSG